MEENKYLNLENTKKRSIFVDNIRNMVRESLTESPTILPVTKPIVKPSQPRPTRKGKPFRITPRETPNPQPKAMNEGGDEGKEIKFINISSEKNIEKSFVADFQVGDLIFDDKEFRNVGLNEGPKDGECGKEPWIYEYKTEPMGDERKVYGMYVTFQCDVNRGPSNNFMYLGAHHGEQPEIWEE